MKSLSTWRLIHKSLQENIPVMLLYVLESNGSSPGRQGFFMAVNSLGEMEGSLGGGIMEHKFVEMAKARMQQDEDEISVHKQIHDKAAPKHQSGMICSGEQTIALYKVHQQDRSHMQDIIERLEANKNGTLNLSPAGILFSGEIPESDYQFTLTSENEWTYIEKIGYKNHLHIIGGGHCSLALSKIMRMMDFYIHIYDDRKNLHTMLKNDFVHEKHEVKDYNELSELVPEGDNNFVVIMTFGYRTDYIALWSLLSKKFRYVGLLGSKSKIEKMIADYLAEGVDHSMLETVRAPIGLDIKSQTPEEIAVSIAAEIIKVKNQDL